MICDVGLLLHQFLKIPDTHYSGVYVHYLSDCLCALLSYGETGSWL